MTSVTAYQKNIRQSPRKIRLVADMVRQMPLNQALTQLDFAPQKAAGTLKKVMVQAQSNAVNNNQLTPDSLTIDQIIIEEGPTYKRWNPVSRGRAHPILKRTSHIKVILKGEEQTK